MKKRMLILCFIIVAATQSFAQQMLDEIVAVVEDEIILSSELTQYSMNLAFQLRIDPRKDMVKFRELQKETLNNLINQKILLAKAEEDSIEVEERQVESVLEEQINRMIEQTGSVQKLEEYLGAPISKIKRNFKDDVRKNLKVETLRNNKFREIKINRREVEEFYRTMRDSLPEIKETVDISHILIEVKAGESSEKEARTRIEELLVRIKAGENFEDICRQFSEDPGSKEKGGEIGFMQRGEFVPEFEEVAFKLEPGQISDVIKSRFGFHIIQSIERRGDKINVRHILIRLEPTNQDEQEAGKKIFEIRAMLNDSTASFGELANKFSDDEESKNQGGHLGLFELDNLQEKEFKAAIASLKPGDSSEPFQTRFGWHILKLNSHDEARPISVEKDWEKIENWALNLKRQREFDKWLDQIKKDVYVQVKINTDEL
ncbi:MAG: peptidylprolyl isomerase [Candidatus Zhuqueibacterota bacterium]